MSVTKANNTVLSVQINDSGKLLIQLHAGSILWQIERDCFPAGWFHLTVTWDNTSKLNVSVVSVFNATSKIKNKFLGYIMYAAQLLLEVCRATCAIEKQEEKKEIANYSFKYGHNSYRSKENKVGILREHGMS